MATNIAYHAALPTCKHHHSEELDFYCYSCGRRICEVCCRHEHKDHEWRSGKKAAVEIRENAEARCDELEEMIKSVELEKETEKQQADIDRINKVEHEWHSFITDIAEGLKAVRLEKSQYSHMEVSREMETMKKMLNFYKNEVHSATNYIAMEVEEEFRILQGNISKHLTTGRKNIIFQEGIISPEVMKYMFGDFVEDVTRSRVTVSEMSHFIHINESVFINTLQHAGPNEVLVHGYSCRQIERIDMTGKLNKEIKLQTDCEDFILIDNDVIYSHFRDMAIRYLPSTGSVSDIYSTAPHFPVGINTSRDGNILVTLCGCSDRNITSESRGHIIQINTSGGLIRKYGYTDCHSDKVLTWPLTVAQNINLDICIIDRLDKDCRSRLVVITISSQVKFIYTGQSSLREMFVAFDVSCDHRGRILVTDLHNHAIHLLNADGHFIQYVLSNQSPLLWPTSLALDRKTLWVGCREGVIRVYNYSD